MVPSSARVLTTAVRVGETHDMYKKGNQFCRSARIFGMRSWCVWRLRAVIATYSSLFVTFALLLTLTYNDNRVIDNLGLDCLSERCWDKWYFCCCPVVASRVCDRGDSDFIRGALVSVGGA